jgi:hypothetical protein
MSHIPKIQTTTIHIRINKPITVANRTPDPTPSCHDNNECPRNLFFTVFEHEASALLETLKNLEGVLAVDGEKTAYGEHAEPSFLYGRNFGGAKAF